MNHVCDKNSSEKVLRVSSKKSKPTNKTCCVANKFTAGSKYPETDGHCKRKRLKTRKERSQVIGHWKETSRTKSYHHQCNCQIRESMAYFQSSRQMTSKKNAIISSAVPVAQEPSIITDSRLTGHHGLFNHEVKSVDIERLLSEQSKYGESEPQVIEKSNDTSHLSSSSHIPALLSSDGMVAADADDGEFKKKDPAAKIHGDYHDVEERNPSLNKQESNITPGQRPPQQPDLSSGSFKSILSSKHSSHRAKITKTKNTNHVVSEKQTLSQLTPSAENDNMKSSDINMKRHMTSGQPHKSKEHQAPSDGFNLNPLQLSSSSPANSFDIQHSGQGPECASESVSAVAARLFKGPCFPLLKQRNLVSEIREVLLKSLQESHGPLLQTNLLEVQKCLRFIHPRPAVRDQEPVMIEDDALLSTDTPIRMRKSRHFERKSTPHLCQSLQKTAERPANPVDALLRPDVSPDFYLDFDPSGTSPCHLFVRSPNLYSGGKSSAFEQWEKTLNKSKSKEPVLFDPFKDNFMNNTAEVEESIGPQYHYNNVQPFFPYQAQLQDGFSAEAMHLSQEQDTFVTDRYSLAPSFSDQIHQPRQNNHLQPFSQYSQPLAFPALSSHHIDMTHYPPSHMLDRSPAPPSSFSSPEQWSFPPMRLY